MEHNIFLLRGIIIGLIFFILQELYIFGILLSELDKLKKMIKRKK